jgi:hypothetical protein
MTDMQIYYTFGSMAYVAMQKAVPLPPLLVRVR